MLRNINATINVLAGFLIGDKSRIWTRRFVHKAWDSLQRWDARDPPRSSRTVWRSGCEVCCSSSSWQGLWCRFTQTRITISCWVFREKPAPVRFDRPSRSWLWPCTRTRTQWVSSEQEGGNTAAQLHTSWFCYMLELLCVWCFTCSTYVWFTPGSPLSSNLLKTYY